jgi:hypothetical protein
MLKGSSKRVQTKADHPVSWAQGIAELVGNFRKTKIMAASFDVTTPDRADCCASLVAAHAARLIVCSTRAV